MTLLSLLFEVFDYFITGCSIVSIHRHKLVRQNSLLDSTVLILFVEITYCSMRRVFAWHSLLKVRAHRAAAVVPADSVARPHGPLPGEGHCERAALPSGNALATRLALAGRIALRRRHNGARCWPAPFPELAVWLCVFALKMFNVRCTVFVLVYNSHRFRSRATTWTRTACHCLATRWSLRAANSRVSFNSSRSAARLTVCARLGSNNIAYLLVNYERMFSILLKIW